MNDPAGPFDQELARDRSWWQIVRSPQTFQERAVRVLAILWAGTTLLLLGLAALGIAIGLFAHQNASRIGRVESGDYTRSKEAGYRNCARDMQTRVELYAAYQQKIDVPKRVKSLVPTEPVLQALLELNDEIRAVGLRRIRRQQPIIDCEANLRNEVPRVLSKADRDAFIAAYLAGELDPTPDVIDGRPTVPFPRGVGPKIPPGDPRSPVPNGAPADAIRTPGAKRRRPPQVTAPSPGRQPQTTPDTPPAPAPTPQRPPLVPSQPEPPAPAPDPPVVTVPDLPEPDPVQPPPPPTPDSIIDGICEQVPVPLICQANELVQP